MFCCFSGVKEEKVEINTAYGAKPIEHINLTLEEKIKNYQILQFFLKKLECLWDKRIKNNHEVINNKILEPLRVPGVTSNVAELKLIHTNFIKNELTTEKLNLDALNLSANDFIGFIKNYLTSNPIFELSEEMLKKDNNECIQMFIKQIDSKDEQDQKIACKILNIFKRYFDTLESKDEALAEAYSSFAKITGDLISIKGIPMTGVDSGIKATNIKLHG